MLEGIPNQILNKLNILSKKELGVEILTSDRPLRTPERDVKRCIEECFSGLLGTMSRCVSAFGCDLVIVTGKPSELPPLVELVRERLPVMPLRVIFARGYTAGNFWPLSSDGVIHDAKFTTVVGAALYEAVHTGLIKDWAISAGVAPDMLRRNQWGEVSEKRSTKFNPVLLEPEQDEKEVEPAGWISNISEAAAR